MEKQAEKRLGIVEWIESIAFSIAVLLVIFLFAVQPAAVSGSSMEPTLQGGDKIILRSAFYTPAKGDIVVIDSYSAYGETLIKRIIALEGDTVDIDFATGDVRVNGELLSEPYILAPTTKTGQVVFPLTVPQGCCFVMGDNRPGSLDSRSEEVGFIDCRNIMGKVFFRLMPHTGGVA